MTKLGRQVDKRCRRLDHTGHEIFHDARKALKAYLGALAFLPDGAFRHHPAMVELTEILGDENDLTTLSHWLEIHGFTVEFASDLWLKIDKSRKLLQQRAMLEAALLVAARKS